MATRVHLNVPFEGDDWIAQMLDAMGVTYNNPYDQGSPAKVNYTSYLLSLLLDNWGGSGPGGGAYWTLIGNNTAATRSLGTTSNQSVNIITNNTTIGCWYKTGETGIGLTDVDSPGAKLHVYSSGADTAAILQLQNPHGYSKFFYSSATPEGVITATRGSVCWVDDGTGKQFLKTTGTGNTGWTQMATGSGVSTFSALTDAYDLTTATAYTVPTLNSTSTALFPMNIFDSVPLSVNAATTAALPAVTYANGAAGVGATLTANANGAFPTIDGVAAALNNRYLVKNQATKLQNGVYTLSTVGNGGTPFVLTRTIDSDATAEFDSQIVIPSAGTLNKGHIFRQNTVSPTVGTSNIVYVTSGLGGNGGGTGIVVDVTTISAGTSGAIPYNGSGIYSEDASNHFWDGTNHWLGVGTNAPTGRVDIKGVSTGTGITLLVKNSTPANIFKILDNGTFNLGLSSSANSADCVTIGQSSSTTNAGAIAIGYQSTSALVGTAVGYQSQATATNSVAYGSVAHATATASIAIGDTTIASQLNAIAIGEQTTASGIGAIILGASNQAVVTNNVGGSFMCVLTPAAASVAAANGFFVYNTSNVVLESRFALAAANIGTHFDVVATNTHTIHSGYQPTSAITVTSVSNSSGALFNFASIGTSLNTVSGDQVITSGFGVYSNQTYYIGYISATQARLYTTRANAIAATSPVAFISNDTGTITPQPRNPVQTIADAAQLYTADNNGTAGTASLYALYENGIQGLVAIIETKTTTGDPTGYEGRMVINTFDKTFKIYAGGGFRTLSSGW